MIHRLLTRLALGGAAVFALATAGPASAQVIVFDPSNYAQNVLTAARSLQQVNNQIRQLENQATSLINQAKNLASLPYSTLVTIQSSIQQTQQLLSQAQRIAYSVTQIDQAFTRYYPQGYTGSPSNTQLVGDAQTRWTNALAGYQDALRVQAGTVQNITATQAQVTGLVTASQGATGALQASQSGNQLLGVIARELADVTALLAAQGRAQSLAGAGTTANQAQASSQITTFLTTGAAYQPQPVTMFH